MDDKEVRPVYILGPTASGKTRLSLMTAEALDGEIVNTDAFSLFKGADVMTAKATSEEQLRVPHHMVDVAPVTEREYSVVKFRNEAMLVLDDLVGRKKTPIIVGGSNYYTESVIFGQKISEESLGSMDFHPNNLRKLIKAAAKKSGEGGFGLDFNKLVFPNALVVILVNKDDQFVMELIQTRIQEMVYLKEGLFEVFWVLDEFFLAEGAQPDFLEAQITDENNRGVLQAIGYKEFLPLYNTVTRECLAQPESGLDKSRRKKILKELLKNPEDPHRTILTQCLHQLAENTYGLYKKQKTWIYNRILTNPLIKPRSLVIEFERKDLTDSKSFFDKVLAQLRERREVPATPTDQPAPQAPPSQPQGGLFECVPCGKFMTGPKQRDAHFQSKSHYKISKKTKKIPPPNVSSEAEQPTLECVPCQRVISGTPQIALHLASSGHKRKVRKAQSANPSSFEPADPFNK